MINVPVDGRIAAAYLALPASGAGPGVLVLHAWWGLTATVRDVADRLAAAGFVALAPDLYNGAVATTIDEAERLLGAMDRGATYATISAASAALRGHPATTGDQIGAIGFSMGGSWALRLDDDIAAIVTFYGLTSAEDVTAKAPIHGHFASDDEFDSADDARAVEQAVQAAGRHATFYIYPNTRHWFFESDRPEYDAAAAALAWERTVAFLQAHLTP